MDTPLPHEKENQSVSHVSDESGSQEFDESRITEVSLTEPDKYRVIRRNGKLTIFDSEKIKIAVTKSFLAIEDNVAVSSPRIHEQAENITQQVVYALTRSRPNGGTLHIEDIQDYVELALMRNGHHKAARTYILYREARAEERRKEQKKQKAQPKQIIHVIHEDGTKKLLDIERIKNIINEACNGVENTSPDLIIEGTLRNVFDGMNEKDMSTALVMGARTLIEKEPNYSYVAAQLLLDKLRRETLSFISGSFEEATFAEMEQRYADYFIRYIRKAVDHGLLAPVLAEEYDLAKLAKSIKPERDQKFTYLGLQTLYDRYFIHYDHNRFELPQAFFMRVAMGLAINEIDRETRAIEFYELLSSFDFMSSTPTLFNSGTLRPQLSSCYLTTVPDDLHGIFEAIQDNAMLSKFAGGLGNSWTRVRAMKSYIKGTNGRSQGIVPFLKVANDTAVAVNQGGKRKGAVCAYLETWHLDIEEFLELRKNTGDDRRRTHDMNTANWIPDLFMKRLANDEMWTLFSPDEACDLAELYGPEFEKRYMEYEAQAERGEIKNHKRINAKDLWRKMLNMLYESGHPWIAFKDPCNLRSPQQHCGIVRSSNLCTEITLNTSDNEIAVCNLGSVNLANHVTESGIDRTKLEKTITTAMRMLDNVIDYNYYSVTKARTSNMRHRPVGIGIMGFQDALHTLRISYASEAAVEFSDRSMEIVSYFAIKASSDLACERGTYKSYPGSLWSQGILPIDSLQILAEQRGDYLDIDDNCELDWGKLRETIMRQGMRNSNTLAIAPTATISNICGVTQSIEPTYQNLFVKSNLSGEFTVINPYLVTDLKKLGIWDEVMINDLKYYDGKLAKINRIPDELKDIYLTAFEIDPCWLVEAAARRQKWIDQSQSLNLYMSESSGSKMDKLYKLAWVRGLKTTYYLRSLGATHVEKSTLEKQDGRLNAVKLDPNSVCAIDDLTCEACQ